MSIADDVRTAPRAWDDLAARPAPAIDPRALLARLADDVRRRRKGAGSDDAQECTVVTATPLTLDGRRTGKTFLARALFVSTTGIVLLLDRPAPAAAFEIEWEGVGPLAFDLIRSRRLRGRFEAALALREVPPAAVPLRDAPADVDLPSLAVAACEVGA